MKHLFTLNQLSLKMISWFLLKMIIILLAISSFYSCKSSDVGERSEPVKVKATFSQVVPGDSTGLEVSRSEINEMAVGSSRVATGARTKATLTRTSEQSYQVNCETIPDTVRIEAEVTCPPVIINQPKPQVVYQTPWYVWTLQGALVAFIVFLLLKQWFNTPATYRFRDFDVDGYAIRNEVKTVSPFETSKNDHWDLYDKIQDRP